MPVVDSSTKFKSYLQVVRLVTSLLSALEGLLEPATQKTLLNHVVDFEGAANYSSSANPGMVKYKEFHTTFKRSLSGRTRAKHDGVMRRPAVKAQWALADSAQRLYMADLEVDTPDGSVPEPPGNYASGFWSVYKSALLGMELRQWYTAHSTTFGYSQKAQKHMTVADHYESNFMTLTESRLRS